MEKGREEGIEQGLQQGLQQGAQQGARQEGQQMVLDALEERNCPQPFPMDSADSRPRTVDRQFAVHH